MTGNLKIRIKIVKASKLIIFLSKVTTIYTTTATTTITAASYYIIVIVYSVEISLVLYVLAASSITGLPIR